MAKKIESKEYIKEEEKSSNVEKLQLIIDNLQKENKKILSENSELITEKKYLNEQIDELENILKEGASQEKIVHKLNKTIKYKYNINDYVFYEEKYQRKPFIITRLIENQNAYKIISEDGLIVEISVPEELLSINNTKTFKR